MPSKTGFDRLRSGWGMSFVTLFAGVSGLVYQFMADGTLLTFLVCLVAILDLVDNRKNLDERDSQLLLQSYGTAFNYLFAAIVIVFLFVTFSSALHIAGPIIGLMNSHWVGIMASTMCIFIGIAGVHNFRDVEKA